MSFVDQLISLVIAPILVGLVVALFSHWLEEKDDN
ncbi:type I toxin-antitoxin system Fst family toxin [Enterococcus sp. BWR-S5]|nr:type I toxin-antitoxin system Fst family toxin [Enterococcus sp. BWR-S5]